MIRSKMVPDIKVSFVQKWDNSGVCRINALCRIRHHDNPFVTGKQYVAILGSVNKVYESLRDIVCLCRVIVTVDIHPSVLIYITRLCNCNKMFY